MSITGRLALQTAIAVVMLAVVGVFGIVQFSRFNAKLAADLTEIGEGEHILIEIEAAHIAFKTQVQEWKNILLRGHRQEDFDKYLKQFGDEEAKAQRHLKSAGQSLRQDQDAEGQALAGQADAVAKAHLLLGERYREALKSFNHADQDAGRKVDALVKGMDRATATGMNELVAKVEEGEIGHLRRQITEAAEMYSSTRAALFVALAVGISAVVVLAWLVAAHIGRSVRDLQSTTEAIAASRDLRLRVEVRGRDEIARAADAFNGLMTSFREVVQRISDNAGKAGASCADMSGALRQISSAVSEQNDATSAVAAAVEQMTVSVNMIHEAASESLSANQATTRSAQLGGEVVGRAAGEMLRIANVIEQTAGVVERVGDQSKEISTIIQVIRDVADQTNLLALNAAIEAARAGEQGRGFAVVADEVRKLAEKTTASASEITRMIDSIQSTAGEAVAGIRGVVSQVASSVTHAQEAQNSIASIRESASRSESHTQHISDALAEQSQASALISSKVERIAQMSEENSTAVISAEAAMRELDRDARALQDTVAQFKV